MNIIAVSVILFGAVQNAVSVGVRVKGQLGGNASVHCSYPKGSENKQKYFNKGKPSIELVRLDRGKMWARNSRFTLQDDKENREFIVTIRNLSVEDAGLYWCGLYKQPFLTEVNLDVVYGVVQDATTENVALVSHTTSSVTVTRQRTTEPQDQQTSNKAVYLGVSLAAVLLLCAVFIIMKKKAKAASTQSEKYTEPDADNCVYDNVIPTTSTSLLTIQSPESIIYATPTPSQNLTRSPPSHCEPAASRGYSRETRPQHPEAVVYSAIVQSQPRPQSESYAPLSTSTQSISLHYSELDFEQRSHVLSDISAFSEASHVYSTVHRH